MYQMHADTNHYVDEIGYFHSGGYFYPFGFWSDQAFSLPTVAQEILRRKALRMVMGHFAFGLHDMIDGSKTYLTILRDPVERILSLYFHARNEETLEELKQLGYIQ